MFLGVSFGEHQPSLWWQSLYFFKCVVRVRRVNGVIWVGLSGYGCLFGGLVFLVFYPACLSSVRSGGWWGIVMVKSGENISSSKNLQGIPYKFLTNEWRNHAERSDL